MRAVVATSDRRLTVTERADPEPGPGEVVVAVERCGICGSDLHLLHSGTLPAGAVLGHELAGTVAARGEGVDGDLVEGARVSVLPSNPCGTCAACRAGREEICPAWITTGLGMGVVDGAYAEFVRVAASSCHPLPAGTSAEQGALVEPFAVALHGVRRSQAQPGSRVGVIGAGPIGLMVVAALRAAGVDDVAVAERSATRADVAGALGASTVVGDATQLATDLDVVFECTGVPEAPMLAVQCARAGGEVILLGISDPTDPVPMVSFLWVIKEVDVRPSLAYSNAEFAEAVGLVAGGAVDVATVISDVRPLDAAQASVDDLGRPGGPVKIMLAP